ncbi:MAG TPA: S9 family peptidase [Thermoanaerobaculia bacterium]|nr:S9 family peptidase [Thermoanaerobaculia bacterium]
MNRSKIAILCIALALTAMLPIRSQTTQTAPAPAVPATAAKPAPAAAPADFEGDVPQPVPGDAGLAGAERPDISRFLNARMAFRPTLSPDGARLSYLTETTGQAQVWVGDSRGGGAPVQATFGEGSVTFQEWSPAGAWIAYGTDRGGDEREGFYLVSPDGLRERELLPASRAFRVWGGWSPDGRRAAFASTERNGLDFDIYLLEVAADGSHSAPRLVHQGSGGLYPVAWRPDGRALVLSQARGEADNDVFLLHLPEGPAGNGRLEALFQPADASSYAGFAWTPDGRGFYVATNQERDLAGLAFYDLAARRLTWVDTPPSDRTAEVEDVALSHDGRFLAWLVNDNSLSTLRLRDLQGGGQGAAGRDLRPEPALPTGVYASLRFAETAPVLSLAVSGPRVPGDIWTVELPAGRTVRATVSATGGLDPGRFVVPEAFSFPSWDRETIHGLLYLPPPGASPEREGGQELPAGSSPPIMLAVHGGPTGQARPEFDAATQYLLTRGIAVFDLNFRGSTGYGKRFTRLDNGRLRPNAVKDMAGALDWLATTGKVDVRRAGVMGGSYGGYLTLAGLAQLPDRFRAGVAFVGVSNWLTALEGASPQLKASDRIEYGDVDDPEDRAFFVELSPLTHVHQVRAPLLAVHGANDPRDPVTETDQFVAALRGRGVPVEYLRFPDEGHGIRKLSNRIIAYRRIAAFLERALGVASADAAPVVRVEEGTGP